MRVAGHVAHIRTMRNGCELVVTNPEEKDLLRDLGIHRRVLLK
jgi:hypothetical protein